MGIAYRIQASVYRDVSARILPYLPPETQVIVDDGPQPTNPWRGYQKCLRSIPAGVKHAVILQDDVFISRNFSQAVERIVEAKPDSVISLFVAGLSNRTRRDFYLAQKAGNTFSAIYFRDIHHVVGMIWPALLIADFLEWAGTHKVPGFPKPRSDDAVVGAWARMTKQQVICTVPCLVEHPDDSSTANPHRVAKGADGGRRAISFIGERDPLELF